MNDDPKPIGDRRVGRFMMQVLWPAFLVSVVAVGVFFSMIDPQELVVFGIHIADNRDAAHTIGFFLFWVLLSIACSITWLLASDPQKPPSLLQTDEDRKHRNKSLIGR